MPPPNPGKIFDTCQFVPPSIENSNELPIEELAVMVIEPSATPQSVGLADATFVMTGATLSVKFTICPVTSQDSSAFLTMI